MTNEHPITPPPELVQRLCFQADATWIDRLELAYQAGADAELEACCETLSRWGLQGLHKLRAARRPKPLSLKEQALLAIDTAVADDRLSVDVASIVRRALEVIPND